MYILSGISPVSIPLSVVYGLFHTKAWHGLPYLNCSSDSVQWNLYCWVSLDWTLQTYFTQSMSTKPFAVAGDNWCAFHLLFAVAKWLHVSPKSRCSLFPHTLWTSLALNIQRMDWLFSSGGIVSISLTVCSPVTLKSTNPNERHRVWNRQGLQRSATIKSTGTNVSHGVWNR